MFCSNCYPRIEKAVVFVIAKITKALNISPDELIKL